MVAAPAPVAPEGMALNEPLIPETPLKEFESIAESSLLQRVTSVAHMPTEVVEFRIPDW